MKILRLRALNINSLQGETEIDFIKFLKGNALFAITGETGSGKSTLLDIIACALYGRTARLKNPEELMSRGTGEAMCEVEFEVRGKVYRSSWTLRRARNKPDGVFQNSKMELSDALTGTIVESKKLLVPKKVEELTGLDFGRFNQSMMLAQGSFDAFLKAPENKRSELLEQITGTKIYSEISKLTHQKYKLSKQEIESIESILEGIQLLEPEILKEKKESLRKNQDEKIKMNKELEVAAQVLEWKKTLVTLTNEYAESKNKLKEVTLEKEENNSNLVKLNIANKALEINALYAKKTESDKATEKMNLALIKLSGDIDVLSKELVVLNDETMASKKLYVEGKEKFESESTKIQKARGFETQAQEKARSASKTHEEINDQEILKKTQVADLNKVIEEDIKLTEKIRLLKNYITDNNSDAELIKNMTLIEQLMQTLEGNIFAYDVVSKNKHTKEKLIDIQTVEVDRLKKETTTLEELVISVKAVYGKIDEELISLEEQEPKLIDSRTILQEAERALLGYRSTSKILKNEMGEITVNSSNIKLLSEKIEPLEKQIKEIKEHIKTLKEKKEQELLIKKYEVDRKNLESGKPCFLCGSTDHPLTEGLHEIFINTTGEILQKKEFSLIDEESSLNSIKRELAVATERVRNNELEIEKRRLELKGYEEILGQNNISITDESEANTREKLLEIEVKIRNVSTKRGERNKLLTKRDTAVSNLSTKEVLLSKANESSIVLKSELSSLNKEESNIKVEYQEQILSLTGHWKTYGLVFAVETYKLEFNNLLQRKKDFENAQKSWSEAVELHKTNLLTKKEVEIKLATLSNKLLKDIEKHTTEKIELEGLKEKRFSLIKAENIDLYAITIKNILEEKLTSFNQIEKKLSEIASIVEEKRKQHGQITLDQQQSMNISKELKEAFIVQLKEKEFKSEEEFTLACMSEESRQELSRLCDKINQAYRDANILEEEIGKRLNKHNEIVLTQKEVPVLEDEKDKINDLSETLQILIGSTIQEIKTDTDNKNMAKEKLTSLSKKKEELLIWIKMNELIGSADGAKFAKFAQGITLDQLIYLANKHLNSLTDRYSIVRRRDEKNLLELDIIDKYQGNEIRPVSTLSGGESFLVSLALALGLSELASQKISIDSLFLDEGFGSLDPDSLETALGALNLLESKGKMVGVISHVVALKEWIPLQIRVHKKGGGTSSIELIGQV